MSGGTTAVTGRKVSAPFSGDSAAGVLTAPRAAGGFARWIGILPVAIAILAVVLMASPAGTLGPELRAAPARVPNFAQDLSASATAGVQLSKGPLVAQTPSTFWSLDLQTNISNGVWTDPTVRSFLNQSPFNWVRYGELTEECNITSNTLYAPNGTVVTGGCLYNLTAFKQWCWSRTPHCHAVLPLPGENNNSGEDAYIAKWIVRTIGFQPDYWSVGNEPTGWKHYGIPWTNWSPSDNSTPTPLAYAMDLKAAITAVRAVDPAARFMGLEAACACEKPIWYQEIIRVVGARIGAIGYHSYPWGGSYNETLNQFYGALGSTTNITNTYARVRADIADRCARCDTLPIFLHEYNAGPGAGHTNFSGGYANAVFLAASVTQALRANVTQFTIFNLQSNTSTFGYAMINRTDSVGPTGILFETVLNHLVRGRVYGDQIHTMIPGIWSALTVGAGRATLLVVNTNLTQNLTIATKGLFTPGSNSSTIAWNPGHRFPVTTVRHLLAAYTIGPQGILLVSVPAGTLHAVRAGPSQPHVADPAEKTLAVGAFVGAVARPGGLCACGGPAPRSGTSSRCSSKLILPRAAARKP
jgi:hypothetical protein